MSRHPNQPQLRIVARTDAQLRELSPLALQQLLQNSRALLESASIHHVSDPQPLLSSLSPSRLFINSDHRLIAAVAKVSLCFSARKVKRLFSWPKLPAR